jgi:hypothetical protein
MAMDDLVQNPEAQKLAQMLQQQQMQKFLQSMQGAGAMSGSDMEMAQRAMAAQPDYGMQSVPMTGQPMQQGQYPQPPVSMFGQAIPQQGAMGAKPAPMPMSRGMGQGAMSNADYEMMRRR